MCNTLRTKSAKFVFVFFIFLKQILDHQCTLEVVHQNMQFKCGVLSCPRCVGIFSKLAEPNVHHSTVPVVPDTQLKSLYCDNNYIINVKI